MVAVFTSDQIMGFRILFAVFALVMLPFSAPFLSAKLRSRFGARRVVASLVMMLIVIPSALALITPSLLKSPYLRFMDRDQRYYSELAHACDLVLHQHPLGTNATIHAIVGTDRSLAELHLSPDDPSVPKIIRDLGPSEISISSDGGQAGVYIMVGVREFGVGWQPQEGNTNSWELTVSPEGPQMVVYVLTNR